MDKQLLEEFYKKYFSKNQLKRRIYNEEELEEIWKEIQGVRVLSSIDVGFKIKNNINAYYNDIEDIRFGIKYINEVNESEIFKYVKNEYEDKLGILEREGLDLNCLDKIYKEKYYNLELNEEDIYNKDFDESDKDILIGCFKIVENHNNIIVKAAIVHFIISVLKPFNHNNIDIATDIANGYLIANGYEMISYCKVINYIKNDERKYNRAIEDSINSNGDITYFIRYYIGILKCSVKELNREITVKKGKKIIKELIEKNNVSLEERQIKFINSMITASSNKITIEDYKKKTKVAYETARTDLNVLVSIGFFKISKVGKKYEYYFNDICTIVDNFNDIV